MRTGKKEILILTTLMSATLGAAIYIFYQDSKVEKKPVAFSEWRNKKELLRDELNQIALPPETTIVELTDTSKPGKTIFLTMRYNTKISGEKFAAHLKTELENKNWVYYGRKDNGYVFCREKSEAVLYYSYGGIFVENPNFFMLHFISSFNGREGVSENCE